MTVSDVERLHGARHALLGVLIQAAAAEDLVVLVGAVECEHALAGNVRQFLPLAFPEVVCLECCHGKLALSAT